MSQADQVSSQDFSSQVLESSQPVLVDFYADWCGPCKMMAPVLDQVAQHVGDQARVVKVNVDEAGDIATQYGIRSIPTLIAFVDGKPAQQWTGLQPAGPLAQKLIDLAKQQAAN